MADLETENDSPVFTRNFDDVLIAEHLYIARRRRALHIGDFSLLEEKAKSARLRGTNPAIENEVYSVTGIHDTIGVSLSGGGIRSAAFSMGAMQALKVRGLLPKVDYLSTVSGGGYAGIASVIAMNQNNGNFPFAGEVDDVKDTSALGVFRDNANYLQFGKLVPTLQNIALIAKGIVANLLLVIGTLLVLAAISLYTNPTVESLSVSSVDFLPSLVPKVVENVPFGISLIVSFFVAALFVLWASSAAFSKMTEIFKSVFIGLGLMGLVATALTLFFELQPALVRCMIPDHVSDGGALRVDFSRFNSCFLWSASDGGSSPDLTTRTGFNRLVAWLQALLAPMLALFAIFSRNLSFLVSREDNEKTWLSALKRWTGTLTVWIAGLALPLLLWMAYLGLFYWGLLCERSNAETAYLAPDALKSAAISFAEWTAKLDHFISGVNSHKPSYPMANLYLVAGLACLLFWLFASYFDPNANSLHGLYRGRLGAAFCTPWGNQGPFRFSSLSPTRAPLLIVNTALNIHASRKVNRRGRNADFFSFSPVYAGSWATGYGRLDKYEDLEKNLDLNTVMAVSGAAASSNMGSKSIRPLTFTLALLNIRLGAWLKNPRNLLRGTNDPSLKKFIPEKMPLYFIAELVGRLNETKSMVYLTDGGHIENLGAYELLRRRCKLIIVIDSEADPEMNFGAYITLQRYARIDLGARIELPWSKIKETSLKVQKGERLAQNGPHCAIGEIVYQDSSERGVLIYVKSSVTGDENDYVSDYNRRHKDYPHETTGDQFFSEEQFEVYRALGFHALNGLLTGEHLAQTSASQLEALTSPDAQGKGVITARKLLGLPIKVQTEKNIE